MSFYRALLLKETKTVKNGHDHRSLLIAGNGVKFNAKETK